MSKVSIAIIGLSRSLSKPTIDALSSGKFDHRIQFPIKIVAPEKHQSTDKFKFIQTNLSDSTMEFISNELKGTDTIVELASPQDELLALVEKLVANVRPNLFIPSQFGIDILHARKIIPDILQMKYDHSVNVRGLGIKVVDIVTNWFAEEGKYLYEVLPHVNLDPETNTYLQIGDLDTKFAYTRTEDAGFVIARVATESSVNSLPDQIRVKSGSISFKELLDRYEQTHNVKLSVGEKLTPLEALAQLKEKHDKSAGFFWGDFFFYIHTLAATTGLDYDNKDNELINPGESIWKWTPF